MLKRFGLASGVILLSGALWLGCGIGNSTSNCNPGDACICNILGNCDRTCTGAGCTFECSGLGNCDFFCPEGGCTALCEGVASNCIMSCPGNNCDMTCNTTGNCIVEDCTDTTCTCNTSGQTVANCVVR